MMEDALAQARRLFEVDTPSLRQIVKEFQAEMAGGLRGEKSSLKMLPTYVGRPRGTEKGTFFVLDMGGTNCRVLSVRLDGKRGAKIEAYLRHKIPTALRRGMREALFDFLVQCIGNFISENQFHASSVAFTFSYPVEQKSISSGVLIRWTKGFSVPGVEGEDVAALLREALRRNGLAHLHLQALVNDTVATLLAASYQDPNFDMAVILGTGTNACYPESPHRLKWPGDKVLGDEVIINLEWGNFNCLPVNAYDCLLDESTPHRGEQRMEKMVSGLYTGELVRLVLLDVDPISQKPYGLTTRYLADLTLRPKPGTEKVREVATLVLTRSARIVAAAIVAVITWRDPTLKEKHRVAVDGALFTGYPGYRQTVETTIRELLSGQKDLIELHPIREASGIGAAVACAISESQGKSV
ncbi:MAG TPA: hypothetical protein PLT64_02070 [Syntrophales bacterium]|nr:hypothetical protein [Syntrophales bacterium]HOL58636.1 hypothetical protein [Syntrophales bacterium]HPO35076.1 hypothetical protein [Syntrophales bacterium]